MDLCNDDGQTNSVSNFPMAESLVARSLISEGTGFAKVRLVLVVVLLICGVRVSLRAQNDGSGTPSVKNGTSVPVKIKASAVPPPDWIKEISPSLPGPFAAMKPCSVLYKLSWNNTVGAGEVTVNLLENGAFWVGTSSAASTGFARALWTYDCTLASVVDRASLRTDHFGHVEIDGGEQTDFQVEFRKDRLVTEARYLPKPGKKDKPLYSRRIFAYPQTDDLLSAILFVRSQKLEKGDRIKRVVQPFNVPYLVTYIVKGSEKRDVQGKDFSTIKVDVEIQKVDRRTLALAAYDKMKSATLWVSDDEFRLPVEIHADIFIGFVSARLVERKFLEGPAGVADSVPELESLALPP